jgi:hypothetical protein
MENNMQRVQLEALKPSMLTDEELARYLTIYTLEQLTTAWVAEVVERFVAKLEKEPADTTD